MPLRLLPDTSTPDGGPQLPLCACILGPPNCSMPPFPSSDTTLGPSHFTLTKVSYTCLYSFPSYLTTFYIS